MAEVIERVETHFKQIPLTGAICGNGHHNPFAKGQTQCSVCKDTMDEVLPGHFDVQLVKGYVMVRCDCNRKVLCSGFTTTCDCGRDYNWNGDLLADRSQWGEETGEHPQDIINFGGVV